MWVIDIVRLDYDDYPIGTPLKTIGPFDRPEEAYDFLNEVQPYDPSTGRRKGIQSNYSAVVNHQRITSPEDYKKGITA